MISLFAPVLAVAEQLTTEPRVGCVSQALPKAVFSARKEPVKLVEHAFTTGNGQKIGLHQLLDGKRALLVNFWTTWCPPCKEEMPSMDRLQSQVGAERLLILPLVRDGKGVGEAIAFYKAHQLKHMPLAADRFGKIAHAHRIGALPQTLFVNRQGMVLGRLSGGVDWQSPAVLKLLESCLEIQH
uniref:Putative thiol-disulfide isomerase and thioredoxins n=1 Tax=Magnetococcus massalia (strain MO-1) TaxID=451514 RepID=A0A1S7LE62_MAGMO|nr:putative thiol-disulfide isomerase and thioredoxins [Candidatus Magnetococcus massalia]